MFGAHQSRIKLSYRIKLSMETDQSSFKADQTVPVWMNEPYNYKRVPLSVKQQHTPKPQ